MSYPRSTLVNRQLHYSSDFLVFCDIMSHRLISTTNRPPTDLRVTGYFFPEWILVGVCYVLKLLILQRSRRPRERHGSPLSWDGTQQTRTARFIKVTIGFICVCSVSFHILMAKDQQFDIFLSILFMTIAERRF